MAGKKSIAHRMGFAIGSGAIVATLSGASALVFAWPVMVALGVLHSQWHVVPAFGFWAVVIIKWGLAIMTPYTHKVEDKP